jgi:hypothetical protein
MGQITIPNRLRENDPCAQLGAVNRSPNLLLLPAILNIVTSIDTCVVQSHANSPLRKYFTFATVPLVVECMTKAFPQRIAILT